MASQKGLNKGLGALFGDYFYAGFETGFHSLIEDPYYEGYIPLAVNLRGYLTKTKLRPFVNVSLGASAKKRRLISI